MAAESSKTRSLSENDGNDGNDDKGCCISNTSPVLLPPPAMLVTVLVGLLMVLAILLGVKLLGVVPMPNPSCSQEATTLACGRGPGDTRCREVSTKKSSSRNQSNAPGQGERWW